jgi:hypothetical protein
LPEPDRASAAADLGFIDHRYFIRKEGINRFLYPHALTDVYFDSSLAESHQGTHPYAMDDYGRSIVFLQKIYRAQTASLLMGGIWDDMNTMDTFTVQVHQGETVTATEVSAAGRLKSARPH